jgi:hypothetical protein
MRARRWTRRLLLPLPLQLQLQLQLQQQHACLTPRSSHARREQSLSSGSLAVGAVGSRWRWRGCGCGCAASSTYLRAVRNNSLAPPRIAAARPRPRQTTDCPHIPRHSPPSRRHEGPLSRDPGRRLAPARVADPQQEDPRRRRRRGRLPPSGCMPLRHRHRR